MAERPCLRGSRKKHLAQINAEPNHPVDIYFKENTWQKPSKQLILIRKLTPWPNCQASRSGAMSLYLNRLKKKKITTIHISMAQQSALAKWKSLLLKEGNVPTKHPSTTTESLYQHKELTLKLKTSIIYQKKKNLQKLSPHLSLSISPSVL